MDGEQQSFSILRPSGSIVSSRSRQFLDEVLSHLEDGEQHLLIDMKDVSFISKEAVIGLAKLSEKVEEEGFVLVLANPRGVVRNLLTLRRSSRSLRIFDSDSRARAFLRKLNKDLDDGDQCKSGEKEARVGQEQRPGSKRSKVGTEKPLEEPSEEDNLETVGEPSSLPSAAELSQGTFELLEKSEGLDLSLNGFSSERAIESTAHIEKEELRDNSRELKDDDILTWNDEELSAAIKTVRNEENSEQRSNDPIVEEELVSTDTASSNDFAGPETVFPVYDFDTLAERLQSSDPKIRWFAARGLGRLGDPRGIDLLLELLSSRREFQFIREMARISMRRIREVRG